MFGIESFSTSSAQNSKFSFNSTCGLTTSITSAMSFNKLVFSYWQIKKKTCQAGNPYYRITDMRCYDICPSGEYANSTLMLCKLCDYTCKTCSS